MATLTLLCVHGVNYEEDDPDFRPSWEHAITQAVQSQNPQVELIVDFLDYDEIFKNTDTNPLTYPSALTKLLFSIGKHAFEDLFETHKPRLFGLPDPNATIGMTAKWIDNEQLRKELRQHLLKKMQEKSYDAVLAHSMGSLICYDTFSRNPSVIQDKVFTSFGSQIGHPAVAETLGSTIRMLNCAQWFHLYNEHDRVFTDEIALTEENFHQQQTLFTAGLLSHDATRYLNHPNSRASLWHYLTSAPKARTFAQSARKAIQRSAPNRKALVIGINRYLDPANKLDGCVNDSYLISAMLQESGYQAEDIRLLLDERATTSGIKERLHWLLDGVRDGDQRFLFYSGHGAQIPMYGPNAEPDHLAECLVPHDFDWSEERMILDRYFCELYSNLPYASQFIAMFDCCHAEGTARDVGRSVRGLTPPDDIRHRALRWDAQEQMWLERDFPSANTSLSAQKNGAQYLGKNGATHRLGRAVSKRRLDNKKFDALCKDLGHSGPYLPTLLEACAEHELSYEYKHGAQSYGAYTFCLVQVLRACRASNQSLNFLQLNELVIEKLRRLQYNQTPVPMGTKENLNAEVPWLPTTKPEPTKPRKAKK